MSNKLGHFCAVCVRTWASNSCWDGGPCNGQPIHCPECDDHYKFKPGGKGWRYKDGSSGPKGPKIDGAWT